jgi:hypothetical protein
VEDICVADRTNNNEKRAAITTEEKSEFQIFCLKK